MAKSYVELVQKARGHHDPLLSANELANAFDVSPPFITDIEKSRRLPSLEKQQYS